MAHFQRVITPYGLLMAGVGCMIGSGWLFGPLYTAQIAGPAAIAAWIIGGVLMLIVTFTFAELGAAFPVAGGMVQYAQYSHGPLVSFMIGWMVWISNVAVPPVEVMAIIQYAATYIPHLVTKVNNVTLLTNLGIGVAAILLLIMCVLNYYGARFFSQSNSAITTFKIIIPIATALLLIYTDFNVANFHAPQTGGFAPYGWHGILAALPLGGIIYAYIGSNTVLQLAGETKNPNKSVPFALITSLILCIAIYILLQTAFVGALHPSQLAAGWSKLSFAGDSGPFAGLLTILGLVWFVIILYGDAMISPFGTGYIYTASTARVNYGLSKIGFFPKALQRLSARGIPVRSMMMNYVVGLILFLPFPGWQSMMGFIISCFIFSYIIGPIALISLRKAQPDHPRPFRLPCAYLFALMAFYICNLLIFWTGWHVVSRMMITLSIGLLFFIVHCVREKNNLWLQQWRKSWWVFPYLIGMGVISYLGTFGEGIGKLSFGWDFAVIAVISFIVFYLAAKISENAPPSFN